MNLEMYVSDTPLCETFNVIMTDYVDTPPAPKTMQVTIPGADGVLDLSEWFAHRPLLVSEQSSLLAIQTPLLTGQRLSNLLLSCATSYMAERMTSSCPGMKVIHTTDALKLIPRRCSCKVLLSK